VVTPEVWGAEQEPCMVARGGTGPGACRAEGTGAGGVQRAQRQILGLPRGDLDPGEDTVHLQGGRAPRQFSTGFREVLPQV
jgi:hypothetical protein